MNPKAISLDHGRSPVLTEGVRSRPLWTLFNFRSCFLVAAGGDLAQAWEATILPLLSTRIHVSFILTHSSGGTYRLAYAV